MKRFKVLIIMLIIFAVAGTAFGILHSLYHESPPVYRPMIYYDGMLLWDERTVEIQPDGMEYIGFVNSLVPETQKPDEDFESNCKNFMNAKLYRDKNGDYYLFTNREKVLLLAR